MLLGLVSLCDCTSTLHVDLSSSPDAVYYKYLPANLEARARKQLRYALAPATFVESLTDLLDAPFYCGPFLWQRLKQRELPQTLTYGFMDHRLTFMDRNGICKDTVMTGMRIASPYAKKDFCILLQKVLLESTAYKIRSPEPHETQLLWKRTSGLMAEPYYILETDTIRLLVDAVFISNHPADLNASDAALFSGLKITYMEDLNNFENWYKSSSGQPVTTNSIPKFFPLSTNKFNNKYERAR